MKPLGADLFCGLGGLSKAALSVGFRMVGFDIEQHAYGQDRYPAQLILQDALTIHGSQLKDAAFIWASPPCQKYSWLAMPWSRSADPENSKAAKALRWRWETEGPDNRLFEACFRIQREAIQATRRVCQSCAAHVIRGLEGYPDPDGWLCVVCDGSGWTHPRYIPMVVENVRGAQEWVGAAFYGLEAWKKASHEERLVMGRSKANYGSFHLWGSVDMVGNRIVIQHAGKTHMLKVPTKGQKRPGRALSEGFNNWDKREDGSYIIPGDEDYSYGSKTSGGSWFRERNGEPQPGIRHEDRGNVHPNGSGDRGHDPDGGVARVLGSVRNAGGTQASGRTLSGNGVKGIETDRQTLPDGTGGTSWFGAGKRGDPRDVKRNEFGEYADLNGTKIGGDWFRDPNCHSKHGSRSSARKQASAMIAKIPEPLAEFVARSYFPA